MGNNNTHARVPRSSLPRVSIQGNVSNAANTPLERLPSPFRSHRSSRSRSVSPYLEDAREVQSALISIRTRDRGRQSGVSVADFDMEDIFPLSAIPSYELRMRMSDLMMDSLLHVDNALSRILNVIEVQRIIRMGPRIFGGGINVDSLEKLPLDADILEKIEDSSVSLSNSNNFDDASSAPKPVHVKDSFHCDSCSICLSTFRDIFERNRIANFTQDGESKPIYICRLPCNHLFCMECLRPWLVENETCPNCRLELEGIDNLYLSMAEKAPLWWASALKGLMKSQVAEVKKNIAGGSRKSSSTGSDTNLLASPDAEEASILTSSGVLEDSADEVIAIPPRTSLELGNNAAAPFAVFEEPSRLSSPDSVREGPRAWRSLPRGREIPSFRVERENRTFSATVERARWQDSSPRSFHLPTVGAVGRPLAQPDEGQESPLGDPVLSDCQIQLGSLCTRASSCASQSTGPTSDPRRPSTQRREKEDREILGRGEGEGGTPILTSGSGGSNVRTIRMLSRMHHQQLYEPYLQDVSAGGGYSNNGQGGRNQRTPTGGRMGGRVPSNLASQQHGRR